MKKSKTKLQAYREKKLISKSELARRAGVSILTIDRIEKGYLCRLDTKRKILKALNLTVDNKNLIFDDEE